MIFLLVALCFPSAAHASEPPPWACTEDQLFRDPDGDIEHGIGDEGVYPHLDIVRYGVVPRIGDPMWVGLLIEVRDLPDDLPEDNHPGYSINLTTDEGGGFFFTWDGESSWGTWLGEEDQDVVATRPGDRFDDVWVEASPGRPGRIEWILPRSLFDERKAKEFDLIGARASRAPAEAPDLTGLLSTTDTAVQSARILLPGQAACVAAAEGESDGARAEGTAPGDGEAKLESPASAGEAQGGPAARQTPTIGALAMLAAAAGAAAASRFRQHRGRNP